MRKIFTLLLCVLIVSTLSAQKPTATIPRASVAPVIGGDIDEVWDEADPVNINLVYINENPTVGSEGETYWKGLWTTDGIYVLAYVADNDYYPYYQRVDPTQTTLGRFDQVEVFFDCNFLKEDGGGGREGGLNGHYKIAPASGVAQNAGYDDGTMHEDYYPALGYKFSINASDDPHYFVEYFVPFSSLLDENGAVVDITGEIGFEVSVIDNDEPGGNNGRNRMVWSNWENGDDDSWDNMDDAGIITLDGAEVIYVDDIEISAEDITEDNQVVTIDVVLTPENPTDKVIKWVIEEGTTAEFKFDNGTITPLTDGVIIVTAWSNDEYVNSNTITINVSGQKLSIHEASWIVDGYNMMPNEDLSPNNAWARNDGIGSHTALIEDGVFHFSSDSVLAQPWSMKVRQAVDIPLELKDDEWVARWKMWAAEETTFQLIMEDRGNGWAHWGIASGTNSENAVPVGTDSRWDLTVTTEPEWFEVHAIPNLLNENSNEDFCFQPGLTGVDIYMDSLYLIPVSYESIIDWTITSTENTQLMSTFEVYPNPARDVLNISLSTVNTRVAIYNSLGIKMDEINVAGNHHTFDVSDYASGLYFVRANNQVVKFVR